MIGSIDGMIVVKGMLRRSKIARHSTMLRALRKLSSLDDVLVIFLRDGLPVRQPGKEYLAARTQAPVCA